MTTRGSIILCDYAAIDRGKLNMLGGSWNVCHPDRSPIWAVIALQVPHERPSGPLVIEVDLLLLGEDGPTGESQGPWRIEGDFSREEDLPVPSVPVVAPIPISTELVAEARYVITARLDDEDEPFAWAPFVTLSREDETTVDASAPENDG